MAEANEAARETELEQMPFSVEEWAQTPQAVQEFVLTLVARVQALEAEVADLREQVNRNSHNSSQEWTQAWRPKRTPRQSAGISAGRAGQRDA
jgi:hypothetical protein